ncbi:MAG: SDR family NAD(P)-dependent oxidoreductase [Gemmatimonadetes bacterium]|nr:SDR family NAD(P)-dependent oxidoreductase [Gemmatimonadota bacterium]MBT7860066.1 SDR family NAD(P)-dependent oxidoreductase [Gemmatimonadota bacterium]
MGHVSGRVVVVTGASSGIGRELSRQLASEGARVALIARRVERLQQLEDEIASLGGVARAFACDLTDAGAVAQLPGRVREVLGPADILVNNAGRGAHGPFEQIDRAIQDQVLRTNLDGVIDCTRAFLPQLQESERGQLVFVSSVLARLPAPEHAVYAATKWAVSGLAESLYYELAPRGIDVVLVEPGLVQSEFAENASTPLARYRWVPAASSAQAAVQIRRAMRRNQPHRIADRLIALVIAVKRHMPRLFRVILGVVYRKARG